MRWGRLPLESWGEGLGSPLNRRFSSLAPAIKSIYRYRDADCGGACSIGAYTTRAAWRDVPALEIRGASARVRSRGESNEVFGDNGAAGHEADDFTY